ncbi:MAG: methylmalonyl-CoA epimerase [Cyclobacteriaceae bacterium]
MKIEHIGIAVKDLETSNQLFKNLFGKKHYKEELVEGENVLVSFFQLGDTKVELLQATSHDSTITKFLEKKPEGIHHMAFSVDDIYLEVERLKAKGFTFLNETPKEGSDDKLIVFLHPKSTNGVLVELCQKKKDQ